MKAAPLCSIAALISGVSWCLSPENERPTKGGAELQRDGGHVDGAVGIDHAALRLRAAVGGGRELAFGQAVNAVVLDDIDHVDAAADGMGELAEADRGGIAVAGNAQIDQVAIGEIGAGEHRRHAAMHGIEAVRIAEKISRRLRRAADAGKLRHPMRRDRQFEAGFDDRRGDRVVAATGAQRRDRALVVAVGIAERVLRQIGMMEFGFDEIGHDTTLRSGVTFSASIWSPIASGDVAGGDRRAVIMQDRHQPHRIDAAFVDDQRAQLRIAVLLDDEDEIVVGDEARHAGMEREGAHPQPVEVLVRRPAESRSPRPSPARSSRNRSRRIWSACWRWPAAAAAPGPSRSRTCAAAAACCRRRRRLPRCSGRSGRARCRG